MYIIRSLRAQGTMIEVYSKGLILNKPIRGMGRSESERITEDMQTQKRLGFIDFWKAGEEVKVAEKKAEAKKEELRTPAGGEVVIEEVTPDRDETKEIEVERYSEGYLKGMRKADLKEFCSMHGIELTGEETKGELVELLLEVEITE